MAAIAESHGWYRVTGDLVEPVYEVPSADGKKMVACTVVHARKFGYLGSVTKANGILAKPAVIKWMVKNGVMCALTHPRRADFEAGRINDDDFLDLVLSDVDEQSSKPADAGKSIHAAIEKAFRGEGYDEKYEPWVREARRVAGALAPLETWVPEQTFAHLGLNYAGRCDLYSKEWGVLDFKTRDFADATKIKPYPEEPLQLAAYASGLNVPGMASLWFSRSNVRDINGVPHALSAFRIYERSERDTAWAAFKAVLMAFQLLSGLPCPQLKLAAEAA